MANPFCYPTRTEGGGGPVPASLVSFAPSAPADWSPAPADAQAALDQLADRVATLEDPVRPGTAALSTVSLSTSSATVLSANTNRLGFSIKNVGPERAYVAFAATASTSAFTADLDPGATYVDETGYTGPVSGVTATGTATLYVTELIP